MELEKLFYIYDLEKQTMKDIYYSFMLDNQLSTQNIILEIKFNMKILEGLIESNFFEGEFIKKKEAQIDPYSINVGYTYTGEKKNNSLKNDLNSNFGKFIELSYSNFQDSKMFYDFSIILNSSSKNQNSLFKLYESIISIPNLKFSKSTQKNIENINILRQGNINFSKCLDLL